MEETAHNPATAEVVEAVGRIPSLTASLLVFGVMIGLLFLTMFLFGDEVAEGPLQVSITIAGFVY
jgi:hypothetical protein